MKTLLFAAGFALVSFAAFSQPGSFILSGGWATAHPDNSNDSFSGYKIGGQWEKTMGINPWAVGAAVNYLHFKESGTGAVNLTKKYYSIPVTFYGKYLIGKDKKLQGYLKAAGGFQFSGIRLENQNSDTKDNDIGFALGTGAGVYYTLSEKMFFNVDYEFLYLTNSWYNNGIVNSVSLGLGFKLQ
jgi:outer membrane protein W